MSAPTAIDWPTSTTMGIVQDVVFSMRDDIPTPLSKALVERAAAEAAQRMFAAVERRLRTL